jgi:hypothetical protein
MLPVIKEARMTQKAKKKFVDIREKQNQANKSPQRVIF